MINNKNLVYIRRQREVEDNFIKLMARIDKLEYFIDNLLKGQDIEYIYVIIDIRVNIEISRIVLKALKKTIYKNKIRYCLKEQVYARGEGYDKNTIFLLLFDDERIKNYLYQRGKMFLTLRDISVMNDREELLRIKLPPIINTIENTFYKIGVYYSHSFGKKIFQYLKKNKNLEVYCINNEIQICNDRYQLLSKNNYDILLFLDLVERKKVYHSNFKKECVALFWKAVLNMENMNYMYDIRQQIIPWLLRSGVKVVLVNSINLKLYPYIRHEMKKSDIRDERTKYLPLKERHRINCTVIDEKELGEALARTKGDVSKGYFRRFHIGEEYNFANGFRIVKSRKGTALNNMFFFGSCIACSAFAKDDDTLCNQVSKRVSERYNVYSKTNNVENTNLVMRECKYKEGDIVVLFCDSCFTYPSCKNLYHFNLGKSINKVPNLGDHILDGMWQHVDKVVINSIAEDFVNFLEENNLLEEKDSGESYSDKPLYIAHAKLVPMGREMYGNQDLIKWLNEIKQFKCEGVNGAIVMNCNPMTNGHMYLIEQAKKYVDTLYVFIVEEDASEFAFKDRINIVRKNVEAMNNVYVLPSGKYVISAGTLEGYFSKKDFAGDSIDASQDMDLFATIAQNMNITYRFVGNEPHDKFTRLYNETMKELLPRYGIEVIEFERKQFGEKAISASIVRALIKERKWSEIKKIVPQYTYEFIINKYDVSNATI